MTPAQIAEKIARNEKYCIRFKLSDKAESFNDLVYGNFVYYVAQNEGDPVIMKSDNYPTYHFANVVDDHDMKITHVLRGIEWQISTPKHIMMYRALGWSSPKYGHLPLIMNADGTKLSKRQMDIKLEFYRERGVFPTALLNYITQAGGGFNIDPSQKLQFYDMKNLIKNFDINRINSNSSRLNPDLLDDLNQQELSNRIHDPEECKKLIVTLRNMIKEKYPLSADQLDLNEEHILNILKWAVNRVSSVNELVEGKLSFLWILPKLTDEKTEVTPGAFNFLFLISYFLKFTLTNFVFYFPEIIDSLVDQLEDENFSKQNLNRILKEFSSSKNLTFSNFMKNLRTMISGLKEGPGVAEMMEILGKENTLQRIIRIKKK